MKRQIALRLAGIGLLATLGCASEPTPKVWVPPLVDLHEYGTLGLIEFESSRGYGPMATQEFMATLHAAQGAVPVLELGALPQVLDAVGRPALDPDTARAIGERYHVDVVVVGDLQLDDPKPRFSIESFTEANASADILGTLNARFLDTRSGATLWSNRAQGSRTVANLNVLAGARPRFGAVDPEGEHGKLVSWLVGRVTGDFYGYWARP